MDSVLAALVVVRAMMKFLLCLQRLVAPFQKAERKREGVNDYTGERSELARAGY